MQKDIHPNYKTDVMVTCACGNTFVTGSIAEEIKIEICSACHPFYTGQKKYVDTEGKVERFQRLQKQAAEASTTVSKRKSKKIKLKNASDSDSSTRSLKDMIEEMRSQQ
ncbi:50S ribosomal protein L31 [candidate division WWE3 bacterium]|uniref:Large ribosomal subunit protein bL31 n=1 Tax=candidate division WWE3 bacterium TaxID=2053526 RepID=A0A955LHW3_UNCKA|nr:50S ribosomal protein L31 [candidate division WWE3 bacterium]